MAIATGDAADLVPGGLVIDQIWTTIRQRLSGVTGVLYHIVLVALSAGLAVSLPQVAQTFVTYWSAIERDKVALVTVEVIMSILLIVCINYFRHSLADRRLAETALHAGIRHVFQTGGARARRKIRQLKTGQGRAKNIMVIGSTGYHTFVDPNGDLHTAIWKSLEAKIMLLNPYSEAARTRAMAILNSNVTPQVLVEQVESSIELCKRLKAGQKSVRLKLYSDPPHVKLAILGDVIWLQHYHTGLDVHSMPEYVFAQNHNDYGLYTLFYQYFTKRWENSEIPEYDLETDELVYRASNGSEIRRERYPRRASNSPSMWHSAMQLADMGLQDR
jgi:hypothetical protein